MNRIAIPKTFRDEGTLNLLYSPIYFVIENNTKRMHPIMYEETAIWCKENLTGKYSIGSLPFTPDNLPSHIHIEFDNPMDAVFFALRWVG